MVPVKGPEAVPPIHYPADNVASVGDRRSASTFRLGWHTISGSTVVLLMRSCLRWPGVASGLPRGVLSVELTAPYILI